MDNLSYAQIKKAIIRFSIIVMNLDFLRLLRLLGTL